MQSLWGPLLHNQSAKNLQSYLSLWKPLHGTRNCGYSSTSPHLSRDQNPQQPEDSDYRIVNCPGGRGECWSFHLTITLRMHIASRRSGILKLLISIIILIQLPDCSNLFPFSPGNSNHPDLESLLAAVLKIYLQTHVNIKRNLQERLTPLVSRTAIRKV